MTQEQFQKAINLNQGIKELETFQKAFINCSVCSIWATSIQDVPPCIGCIRVDAGDDLHTIISDYVSRKVDDLKAEIENL